MEAPGQQTAAEEMQAWNVLMTHRLGDNQNPMKSMCIFAGWVRSQHGLGVKGQWVNPSESERWDRMKGPIISLS